MGHYSDSWVFSLSDFCVPGNLHSSKIIVFAYKKSSTRCLKIQKRAKLFFCCFTVVENILRSNNRNNNNNRNKNVHYKHNKYIKIFTCAQCFRSSGWSRTHFCFDFALNIPLEGLKDNNPLNSILMLQLQCESRSQ